MLNSFRVVFVGSDVTVDPIGCDYDAANIFYSFDWGMTGEYSHRGGTGGAKENWSHDSRSLNDIVTKYGAASRLYNYWDFRSDTCDRFKVQYASKFGSSSYWKGDRILGGAYSQIIGNLPGIWTGKHWDYVVHKNNDTATYLAGDVLNQSIPDDEWNRTFNNGVFSQFWQEDYRTASNCESVFTPCVDLADFLPYFNTTKYVAPGNGGFDIDNRYPKGPSHPQMPLAKRQFELFNSPCMVSDGFFGTRYRTSMREAYYLPSWYVQGGFASSGCSTRWHAGYAVIPNATDGMPCSIATNEITQWDTVPDPGLDPDDYRIRYSGLTGYSAVNYVGTRAYEGVPPQNYDMINQDSWWYLAEGGNPSLSKCRGNLEQGLDNRSTYFGRPHWFDLPDTTIKSASDFFLIDGGFISGDSVDHTVPLGFDGGRLVGPYKHLRLPEEYGGEGQGTPEEPWAFQCFMVLDPEEHWDPVALEWTCDPENEVCKTCFLNDYGSFWARLLDTDEIYDETIPSWKKFINREGTLYYDWASANAYANDPDNSGCNPSDGSGPHGLGCFVYPLQFIAGTSVTGRSYLGNTTYRNPGTNLPPTGITGQYCADFYTIADNSDYTPESLADWTYVSNFTEDYDVSGINQPGSPKVPPTAWYTDRVVTTGTLNKRSDRDYDVPPNIVNGQNSYTRDYHGACTDQCACYNSCGCYTWGTNPVTGWSDPNTAPCTQFDEILSTDSGSNPINYPSLLDQFIRSECTKTDRFWNTQCSAVSTCATAKDIDTRHQEGSLLPPLRDALDNPTEPGLNGTFMRGPYMPMTEWVALHGSGWIKTEFDGQVLNNCHMGNFTGVPSGFNVDGPMWDFNKKVGGTNELGDEYYIGADCPQCKFITESQTEVIESLDNNVSVSSNYRKTQAIVIDPGTDQYDPTENKWPKNIYIGAVGAGGPGGSCILEVPNVTDCGDDDFKFRRLCINSSGQFTSCTRQGESGTEGSLILNTCDATPRPLYIKVEKLGKGGLTEWEGIELDDIDKSSSFPTWTDRHTKVSIFEGNEDGDAVDANLVISIEAQGGRAVAVNRETLASGGCGELTVSDVAENIAWDQGAFVPKPGSKDISACAFCGSGFVETLSGLDPGDACATSDDCGPNQVCCIDGTCIDREIWCCRCNIDGQPGKFTCTLVNANTSTCGCPPGMTPGDGCVMEDQCCPSFDDGDCATDCCQGLIGPCGGGGGGGGCSDPPCWVPECSPANCDVCDPEFDTPPWSSIPCCFEIDGEVQCVDRTVEECEAEGGVCNAGKCLDNKSGEVCQGENATECEFDEICYLGWCLPATCTCLNASCGDDPDEPTILCCHTNELDQTLCEDKTEFQCNKLNGTQVDDCQQCGGTDPCDWCDSNPELLYADIFDLDEGTAAIDPPQVIVTKGDKYFSNNYVIKYNSKDDANADAFSVLGDNGEVGITDVHKWHELAGNVDTEIVTYNKILDRYEISYDVNWGPLPSDDGYEDANGFWFVDANGLSRCPHSVSPNPWGGVNNCDLSAAWEPNKVVPDDFPNGWIWRLGKTYIFDQSGDKGNPGTRAIFIGSTKGGIGDDLESEYSTQDRTGEVDSTKSVESSKFMTNPETGAPLLLPAPWAEYIIKVRKTDGTIVTEYLSRDNPFDPNSAPIAGYTAYQAYQRAWEVSENTTENTIGAPVIERRLEITIPETLDELAGGNPFINLLHRRTTIKDSNGAEFDETNPGPGLADVEVANQYAAGSTSPVVKSGGSLGQDEVQLTSASKGTVSFEGGQQQTYSSDRVRSPNRMGVDSSDLYALAEVEEFHRGSGTYSLVLRLGFSNTVRPEGDNPCSNFSDTWCECPDEFDFCRGGDRVYHKHPIIGPIRPSRSKRIIKPGIGGCGSLRLLQPSVGANKYEAGGANGGGAFVSWGPTVEEVVANLS